MNESRELFGLIMTNILKKKRLIVAFHTGFSILLILSSLSGYPVITERTDDPIPLKFSFDLSQPENKSLFWRTLDSDSILRDNPDLSSKHKPKKHLGRAVLEFFALMAYSQTRYWVTYGDWIEDWHYRLTWKDQTKRFFTLEAWRFDSNCFDLNCGHALSGAMHYNFARTNNLNKLESFLFCIGSSFYWEYIVEWRNVLSINDAIYSIMGGSSLGEAWYQLGKYFFNKKGLGNRILGFVNPILKFNRWLDRKELKSFPKEPEPGWHEFNFFLGSRHFREAIQEKNQGCFFGGVHTQLVSIPEFGKPGQFSRNVRDTLFSEIYFDLAAGNKGVEEINLFSRAVFFGHFEQNINEQQKGYAYYLGLGSAVTYHRKRNLAFYDSCKVKVRQGYDLQLEEARNFKDKFSIIHLAGPVLDFRSFGSKLKLRLMLNAYLDFAIINAFALNKYSEGRDISGIKTNLLYYGYYYGLGTTLCSGLSVEFGNLELGGLLRYHSWGSLDGRDRFQDDLTNDFHVKDSRLQFKLSLGYWITGTPVELVGSFESIDRKGNIKNIHHKELESRLFFGLNFKF